MVATSISEHIVKIAISISITSVVISHLYGLQVLQDARLQCARPAVGGCEREKQITGVASTAPLNLMKNWTPSNGGCTVIIAFRQSQFITCRVSLWSFTALVHTAVKY